MRVVLVPTIVAGVNVDQLGPIFRFALEHSHHVTGISVQPMAATGRVKVLRPTDATFNLADLALEFSRQTGLTRVPDDWIPLNALTMLTRGVARLRGDAAAESRLRRALLGWDLLLHRRRQPTHLPDELPRPRAPAPCGG